MTPRKPGTGRRRNVCRYAQSARVTAMRHARRLSLCYSSRMARPFHSPVGPFFMPGISRIGMRMSVPGRCGPLAFSCPVPPTGGTPVCDVPHLQVGDLVIEAEAVDLYRRGQITWSALLDFGTQVYKEPSGA